MAFTGDDSLKPSKYVKTVFYWLNPSDKIKCGAENYDGLKSNNFLLKIKHSLSGLS